MAFQLHPLADTPYLLAFLQPLGLLQLLALAMDLVPFSGLQRRPLLAEDLGVCVRVTLRVHSLRLGAKATGEQMVNPG